MVKNGGSSRLNKFAQYFDGLIKKRLASGFGVLNDKGEAFRWKLALHFWNLNLLNKGFLSLKPTKPKARIAKPSPNQDPKRVIYYRNFGRILQPVWKLASKRKLMAAFGD